MKRLLTAVAILAFLSLPQAAQAQRMNQHSKNYGSPKQLAKVDAIGVAVSIGGFTSASLNCLPSPKELRREAELILERAGITVTNRAYPAHTLNIRPINTKLTGDTNRCLGTLIVELWRLETLRDETTAMVYSFTDGDTIWGSVVSFREQLLHSVNHYTTKLALEIFKARTKYPQIYSERDTRNFYPKRQDK